MKKDWTIEIRVGTYTELILIRATRVTKLDNSTLLVGNEDNQLTFNIGFVEDVKEGDFTV